MDFRRTAPSPPPKSPLPPLPTTPRGVTPEGAERSAASLHSSSRGTLRARMSTPDLRSAAAAAAASSSEVRAPMFRSSSGMGLAPVPEHPETLERPQTPENRLSMISVANTTPDSKILWADEDLEPPPRPVQLTRAELLERQQASSDYEQSVPSSIAPCSRRAPPSTPVNKRASAAISRGVSELAAVFEPVSVPGEDSVLPRAPSTPALPTLSTRQNIQAADHPSPPTPAPRSTTPELGSAFSYDEERTSRPLESSSPIPLPRTLRVTNLSRNDIEQQARDQTSSSPAEPDSDPFTHFDQPAENLYSAAPPQNCRSLLANPPQGYIPDYYEEQPVNDYDNVESTYEVDDPHYGGEQRAGDYYRTEATYEVNHPAYSQEEPAGECRHNESTYEVNHPDYSEEHPASEHYHTHSPHEANNRAYSAEHPEHDRYHIESPHEANSGAYSAEHPENGRYHTESTYDITNPVLRSDRPQFATHFSTPNGNPTPRPSLLMRQPSLDPPHPPSPHIDIPSSTYHDRRSIVRAWADDLQQRGTPGFEHGAAGLSASPSLHHLPDTISSEEATHLQASLYRTRVAKICRLCKHADGPLADNPYCCADPARQNQRACPGCWDAYFLELLDNAEPAAWFRCAGCHKTLLPHDRARLASRGTLFRHRVKIMEKKIGDVYGKMFGRLGLSGGTTSVLSFRSGVSGGESVRSRGDFARGGLSAADRRRRANWA